MLAADVQQHVRAQPLMLQSSQEALPSVAAVTVAAAGMLHAVAGVTGDLQTWQDSSKAFAAPSSLAVLAAVVQAQPQLHAQVGPPLPCCISWTLLEHSMTTMPAAHATGLADCERPWCTCSRSYSVARPPCCTLVEGPQTWSGTCAPELWTCAGSQCSSYASFTN